MAKSRKPARRRRTMPLWGAISLIIIFGVVALVLSYAALTRVGSGEHPGLPTRPGAAPPEEAPASAASLSIDSEPDAVEEQPTRATSQRLLVMANGTAMRANGGTCGNPGMVEISLDAGQSWETSGSLAAAGATQILRLIPISPSLVQVVALDDACEPQVYRSADLGASWEGPLPAAGSWYLDPSNPAQLGAPDGVQSLPCEGVELAAEGNRAAVQCAGGSVVTTADRGVTWSEAPGITGVLALDSSSGFYVTAQGGDPVCEGIRLTTLGDDPSTTVDGCFQTDLPDEDLTSGDVAVAQSGTYTLLQVGDDLVTSIDGGTTWL